jgi:hypothetical protein
VYFVCVYFILFYIFLQRVLAYGTGQGFEGNNQATYLTIPWCCMFYAHVSVSSNLLHSYVTETEIINTMQKKNPSIQNICLKDWKHHWYLSRIPWKSMTLASHLYVCEQLIIGILCLTQIYNVHVIHITSLTSGSEQVVGSNVPVWIRWRKQPILNHNNQIQHESVLKD